jgi:hypothetical protein
MCELGPEYVFFTLVGCSGDNVLDSVIVEVVCIYFDDERAFEVVFPVGKAAHLSELVVVVVAAVEKTRCSLGPRFAVDSDFAIDFGQSCRGGLEFHGAGCEVCAHKADVVICRVVFGDYAVSGVVCLYVKAPTALSRSCGSGGSI